MNAADRSITERVALARLAGGGGHDGRPRRRRRRQGPRRPTCRAIRRLYGDDDRFRSTIDMGRHRYGEGQYRYFARPLPDVVDELRARLLAPPAPDRPRVGRPARRPGAWPDDLDAWLATCHRAGQQRPTPLMLRYGPGDWNALHRDLYGDLVFPLQVVVGLDRPGADYTGGELVARRAAAPGASRAPPCSPSPRVTPSSSPPATARSAPPVAGRASPMRHGASIDPLAASATCSGLIFHDAA